MRVGRERRSESSVPLVGRRRGCSSFWLFYAYMMFHSQGPSRHCSLLAVLSGKSLDSKQKQKEDAASEDQSSYPFPELSSSGRLEVTAEFILVLTFVMSCFCFCICCWL